MYFATLFDHRYLNKGIALFNSLLQHSNNFKLYILCLDESLYWKLEALSLPHVILFKTDDLIQQDSKLQTAQENRKLVEFYFTLKSFLMRFIFENHRDVDLLTYLDADTFFFSDSVEILKEMHGFSIGLTPHRFRKSQLRYEKYGKFNAGFISIRRDRHGLDFLEWWKDCCFTWCHDYLEDGKYADQLYLDSVPEGFENVKIINHNGINLAPWNTSLVKIRLIDGKYCISDEQVVLYHFHGLRKVYSRIYATGFSSYKSYMKKQVKEMFCIYLDSLMNADNLIASVPGQFHTKDRQLRVGSISRRDSRFLRILARIYKTLLEVMYFSYLYHAASRRK